MKGNVTNITFLTLLKLSTNWEQAVYREYGSNDLLKEPGTTVTPFFECICLYLQVEHQAI